MLLLAINHLCSIYSSSFPIYLSLKAVYENTYSSGIYFWIISVKIIWNDSEIPLSSRYFSNISAYSCLFLNFYSSSITSSYSSSLFYFYSSVSTRCSSWFASLTRCSLMPLSFSPSKRLLSVVTNVEPFSPTLF